jgi:hypothetical protein
MKFPPKYPRRIPGNDNNFIPHNRPITSPLRDYVFVVVLFPPFPEGKWGEVVLGGGRMAETVRQPGD